MTDEELKDLYTSIIDSSNDAVISKDLNGMITSWNKSAERIYGYSADEVIGKSIAVIAPPEQSDEIPEILERLRSGDHIVNYETIRLTKNGSKVNISLTISPIYNARKKIVGASVIARDITDRKRTEGNLLTLYAELERRVEERTEQLIEAYRALEREMIKRMDIQKEILTISEREQKRIGQDLHDGLAQQLAGLSFMSKTLQQKLSKKSLPEADDLSEIGESLKKAIDDTRRISRGFFPIELEKLGLFHALRELLLDAEKMFGIVCHYHFDETIQLKNETLETHIYRITQEAVSNGIKHGKARNIAVSLVQNHSEIMLKIDDDGLGIDTNQCAGKGMGMHIMNYRAKIMAGTLKIEKRREGGTSVVLNFKSYGNPVKSFQNSSLGFAGEQVLSS